MPRSNKEMLRVGALLVVGVIAAVLLIRQALDERRSRIRSESHAIVRTRSDIKIASIEILDYVQVKGILPDSLSPTATADVDTKKLYTSLFGDEAAKNSITHTHPHWHKAQDIVDRWGVPLNFRVQLGREAGARSVRIWSNGLNKRNEDGKGDDLSPHAFQVSVRAGNH